MHLLTKAIFRWPESPGGHKAAIKVIRPEFADDRYFLVTTALLLLAFWMAEVLAI